MRHDHEYPKEYMLSRREPSPAQSDGYHYNMPPSHHGCPDASIRESPVGAARSRAGPAAPNLGRARGSAGSTFVDVLSLTKCPRDARGGPGLRRGRACSSRRDLLARLTRRRHQLAEHAAEPSTDHGSTLLCSHSARARVVARKRLQAQNHIPKVPTLHSYRGRDTRHRLDLRQLEKSE